ncbi:hypothetical protein J6590_105872, partial [Homalodisca vitripennis]
MSGLSLQAIERNKIELPVAYLPGLYDFQASKSPLLEEEYLTRISCVLTDIRSGNENTTSTQ